MRVLRGRSAWPSALLAVLLYGLLRGGWLDAVLAGIALGMSMLPEEFPLVLTVFMVMGAWRISQARVLTRRAAAIETLGAATVLCTDKTGTLTENRMTVAELACRPARPRSRAQLPARFRVWSSRRARQRAGALRSDGHARFTSARRHGRRAARRHAGRAATACAPELLAVTQVWQTPDDGASVVAAKGAPEAIADAVPASMRRPAHRAAAAVEAMARSGMRVLGVAAAPLRRRALPDTPHDFAFELLGLVGPRRSAARRACRPRSRECRAAGIRVVMITGDYPATARAIAAQAGLDRRRAC